MRNLERILREAGANLNEIVKVTIVVTDMTNIDRVIALRRE